MKDHMYLVQRGKFNRKGISQFDKIYGRESILDLDYMGAAEFEWGALPKSLKRMLYGKEGFNKTPNDILIAESKIENPLGVKLQIVTSTSENTATHQNAEEILNEYLYSEGRNLDSFLHEPMHFREYVKGFEPNNDIDKRYLLEREWDPNTNKFSGNYCGPRFNFWWCIDEGMDFMFFFGAEDRIKAMKRAFEWTHNEFSKAESN